VSYKLVESDTFLSWIENLRDRKAKQVIASRLARLELGLIGDAVSVGHGISEARIHYGPGYRIYFQVRGSEIILLLCGGDKSSQPRDIEQAKLIAAGWRPEQ
jgi:putative addiction module killer protein